MPSSIFSGAIPALMTPCNSERQPDFDALVRKGESLLAAGMSALVYCGSMGDWPLLTDAQRQEGVARLVAAGLPVIVGTGALNSSQAQAHAAHAQRIGAQGLMLIPRVLSRGTSVAAQRAHFAALLAAAPDLPAVIYNSPYYGFSTDAELFFALRREHPNLVGFKEFSGAEPMSAAAEHITCQSPELSLLVGVDTCVYHGMVNCLADGAITGIGNVLPEEVLQLVHLCRIAATGNNTARVRAQELDAALAVLSSFDAGPDLVLYYKHLLTVLGEPEYELNFLPSDSLSASQRRFAEGQLRLFQSWHSDWSAQPEVQVLLAAEA